MKQMPQDLRTQTLDLVNGNNAASGPVEALISAWLGSLDDEDLAGTSPESLAPVLRDGFTQAELDSVRQAWAQRRSQALTDESNVASLLASNLYWNDTMKRWTDFDEKIRNTTLDQVNAARTS